MQSLGIGVSLILGFILLLFVLDMAAVFAATYPGLRSHRNKLPIHRNMSQTKSNEDEQCLAQDQHLRPSDHES